MGYASQVYDNYQNNGGDLGNALTTNISGEKILGGAVVGATLGLGVGVVSILAGGGVAAVEGIGTVGAAALAGDIENFEDASSKELTNPETGTALARTLGKAGELASGIVKNTERIVSLTKTANYRIPDQLLNAQNLMSEVKNVANLSLTNQLQEFTNYAQQAGYTFELWTREATNISKPLQELIDNGQIIHKLLDK